MDDKDNRYMQDGKAVLPLGTLTVEETKAPNGYLLDGAYMQAGDKSEQIKGLYVTQITEDGNLAVLTGSNQFYVSDKVIRGGVKIQKRDLETGDTKPQGSATLKDTAFDIISLNDNAVLVEGKLYKKNEVVKTIHTDIEGIASTSADLLPYGNFRIVESEAPDGYLTDGAKAIDFAITENGKIVDLTDKAHSIYNQVKRGDIEGVKIGAGTHKRLADVHPDIIVEKKSDSPDEDKCVHDSKLLIPTLKDFFSKHPLINPKTFLGDAAFDSCLLYRELLTGNTFGQNKHFAKAYIPLNSRSGLENPDYKVNEDGIPCCPDDDSLPMKHEGTSTRKNGLKRYKFICPKIKYVKDASTGKYHRHCICNHPCTASECGRMIYVYPEKDLRAYPGTIRGTEEWDNTYKIRTAVERDINHIKENLCLAGRRTQNEKTLYADLILAGITQLITVILADKIKHHEYIRSLKPLIA